MAVVEPDSTPGPGKHSGEQMGFLLELASGDGVCNLSLGEQFRGADLTDFYPDQGEFPPKRLP